MKTVQVFNHISILPEGYGHNRVFITFIEEDGTSSRKSVVTNNTRATDAYRSDDEDESWEEARLTLTELVLDRHGIEYDAIEFI